MRNYQESPPLSLSQKLVMLVLLTFGLLAFSLLTAGPSVSAQSTSNFRPGNIIDDSVFFNDSAMSINQIQQFMDSKVPNCDTNGEKEYRNSGLTRAEWAAQSSSRQNPPYTCLKEYTQNIPGVTNGGSDLCTGSISSGTKSSARIIHEVSKACGINPQVLLVMMQKEFSLVTDDWTWQIQYDKAMGYACPDSGPNYSANCDTSYYGFFNQVYNAAKAFRRYEANPTQYNYRASRNNNILYNPNPDCGSSNVFIENQATANLYIYTPYQPNSATLAAAPGQEVHCGAYGNLNFWRFFNNWFGSTTGTPFFKVAGDNKTYTLGSNNNYYHVQTYDVLEAYGYGKHFSKIASMPSTYLDSKTFSGPLTLLARFETAPIYLIDRAGKYHFQTTDILSDYGYSIGDEVKLPASMGSYFPESGKMRSIIQEYRGSRIFLMDNGERRRFVDNDAYQSGDPAFSSLPFVRLSSSYMNSLSATYPILAANKLIQTYNDGAFAFWNGEKYFNISRKSVSGLELSPDYELHRNETLNLQRHDKAINVLSKSHGKYYLLDSKRKLEIRSDDLTTFGLTDSDFIDSPGKLLGRIPTEPMSRLITVAGSGTKFFLSDRHRSQFDSRLAVTEKGFTYDDIVNLSAHSAEAFPQSNSLVLETGTLFKIIDQPQTYLINSSESKVYIESSKIMEEYGFNKRSVRTFTEGQVSGYPTVGTLGFTTKDSSDNIWIVHSGGKSQNIESRLLENDRLGININNLNKLSSNIYKKTTNTGPLKDLLMDEESNAKYIVLNGEKRWLLSREAVLSTGYTYDDISTVSRDYLDSLPSGAPID